MSFRLLGFPVTVDPGFLLIALLLGAGRADYPVGLIIWVGVVFVSIVIHELGHAVAARAYGYDPQIRLYAMGGLTIWRESRTPVPRQRLVVSLAGPVAGFLTGGVVWALRDLLPLADSLPLRVLVGDLLWVNIGWGLLNLIPMFPLDGGQVMRSIFHAVRGPDDRLPLQISIGVGVLGAVLALLNGWLWAAFLAGLLTWENVRLLRGAAHG